MAPEVAEVPRHVHDSNRLGGINRLHAGHLLHHRGADKHDIARELVQRLRDLHAVQEKQVIDGVELKPTHLQDGREADEEEAAAGAAVRGGEPELDAVLHERVRHARHLLALLPGPRGSRGRRLRRRGSRSDDGAGRGHAPKAEAALRARRIVGRQGRRRGSRQEQHRGGERPSGGRGVATGELRLSTWWLRGLGAHLICSWTQLHCTLAFKYSTVGMVGWPVVTEFRDANFLPYTFQLGTRLI